MRITRETLLKLARDTAAQRSRADRGITCIYLSGSLRRDDPLLGGTADIDLFFVHDHAPQAAREIVRLSDEIHLDISHLDETIFRQPRHLRADAWVGSYLCDNPIILYENHHWFEYTQASVNAQFYRPDYVYERSRPLAETARQNWLKIQTGSVSPGPQKILAFFTCLEKATNAIACLSGVPLTERRFLLNFPQRAQVINRPDLASALLTLVMDNPVPEETWQGWMENWQSAFRTASALTDCPARLHPSRRTYYQKAALAMRPDHPEAAAWIILRTWTYCLCTLPDDTSLRQAWDAAMKVLKFDETQITEKLTALDAYLDSVEENLDLWAKNNGV
jgi:hypothetical protein